MKADTILDDFAKYGKTFTFLSFDSEFRGKQIDVLTYYDLLIQEMRDADRVGSLSIYQETRKLLAEYHKGKLSFIDITPNFMDAFERHLRTHRSTSETSVRSF